MSENQASDFYFAVKRFLIEEWGRSCAGPWWEGDLQLSLGCSLRRSLGSASGLVELKQPGSPHWPGFLRAWPKPIMTRRLVSEYQDPAESGRGKFPDLTYWPPDADERLNIELKLCSVNGSRSLDNEVGGCVSGLRPTLIRYSMCSKVQIATVGSSSWP